MHVSLTIPSLNQTTATTHTMAFLQQFRTSISRSSSRSATVARRTLTSTSPRRTATGYGDPEDEKPASEAKPPTGAESKAPKGEGGPVKSEGGKEDHQAREQGSSSSSSGGGGGGDGGGGGGEKTVKETKKIGESPKKEEVDPTGPIGG